MVHRLSRTYSVDYSHVDPRGLARPSFLWYMMQDAAIVHAHQLGLIAPQIAWVISRAMVSQQRPLQLFERVRCETRFWGAYKAQWYRSYHFFVDNQPIGQACAMWITIDAATHQILRPTALPHSLSRFACLDHAPEQVARLKTPCPLPEPCIQHTVQYPDLDLNHHLNHVRAVELISAALSPDKDNRFVHTMQVNFNKQVMPGDTIGLSVCSAQDHVIVVGHKQECPHFIAQATCLPVPAAPPAPKPPADPLLSSILQCCTPLCVLRYAEKRTMATGKLKQLSLCLLMPTGTDTHALRTQLYLAICSAVPVSLNIYTKEEWQALLRDPSSYAYWINQKGRVIYEQTA